MFSIQFSLFILLYSTMEKWCNSEVFSDYGVNTMEAAILQYIVVRVNFNQDTLGFVAQYMSWGGNLGRVF